MPYPAGRFFKRKNPEIPQRQFRDFGAQRGSGGYALCKRKYSDSHGGEAGCLPACVYTQAVLAIRGKLPVGNLRVVRA